MRIEEIQAMFLNEYINPKLMRPVPNDGGRPAVTWNHHIYSYAALPLLFNKLKTITPDPDLQHLPDKDHLERLAVRYIVDANQRLWFAQEGHTGGTIPAHSDIRSTCFSAGNIFFSEDYQSIVKITNKSGHFRPAPATLIWAIAALSSVGAPFASNLILEFQGRVNDSISLTSDQLLSLLPEGSIPSSPNEFIIEISSRYDIQRFMSTEEFDLNSLTIANKRRDTSQIGMPFQSQKRQNTSSSSSSSSFPTFFSASSHNLLSNLNAVPIPQHSYESPPPTPR